jgi:hypothetical protein
MSFLLLRALLRRCGADSGCAGEGGDMRQNEPVKIPLETQLGLRAMRFRSTRDEAERDQVAVEYEHIVDKLIASGKWQEMPPFEDMLPDERMPKAFFKFWSIPVPDNPQNGKWRA